MDLEMLELIRRVLPLTIDIVDVLKHSIADCGQEFAARRLRSFSY